MQDEQRTREQLATELCDLRERLAQLERLQPSAPTERALEAELQLNTTMADLSNALINSSVDVQEIAGLVLASVTSLTDSGQGHVVVFTADSDDRVVVEATDSLKSLAVTEHGPELAGPCDESSDDTGSGDGASGFYTNSPTTLLCGGQDVVESMTVSRLLCVPAIAEGQVLGYITIADAGRDYTRKDLSAVKRIAALYALGLKDRAAQDALIEHKENLEDLARTRASELVATNEKLKVEVAERQRADKALRTSEEKYRTLVESAGESIATVSDKGVFLFMNTTGARRLGGAPSDFIGKAMWDIFPKEIADRQMGSIRQVLGSGTGTNVVVPTEVQGQLRWHNTTVEPLRDSDGSMNAAMVIARDIHDLKQAQEQLEKHREEMARTEHLASLATLSAAISHELTQPLTVISLAIGNTLAELEGLGDCETIRDNLQDAVSGVDNITQVIDGFRRFAGRSVEKGVGPVCLGTVAQRVMQLLDEQAWRAKVTMTLEGFDELPAISANERDLEQLFFLLTENAIHAACRDRPNCLEIRGKVLGSNIEILFVDDCGGIEPKDLDRIFDPFFTTKPTGEGTGLGLCVVERIVSRAGGRIKVDSKYGKGTAFQVSLPVNTRTD